jgi:hypothetical protein
MAFEGMQVAFLVDGLSIKAIGYNKCATYSQPKSKENERLPVQIGT